MDSSGACPSIFLIGSYNGQDSLGDKCLLRAVARRFRRLLPGEVPIFFHADDPSELRNGGALSDVPVEAQKGVQSYFWDWHAGLRRLLLSEPWRDKLAPVTFPLAAMTFYRTDTTLQTALRQLDRSAFMFVFGGTQFSKQWWRMNSLPYMLMARMADLPVYFGPQQYGPMTEEQRRRTRSFIEERVRGVRFRNPSCLPELGMDGHAEKLTRDEVFSNTQVYPVIEERSGQDAARKTVLVNFRGEQNFLTEGNAQTRLQHLVDYLRGLRERLDCSFTFFSVSGPEFCDDTECLGYVRRRLPEADIDELPYRDAEAHLEAAQSAYGTVSMSLHGCILSMIGGCPAIPISHGEYYDHKYRGFDKYNPAQPIPIFHVDEPPSSTLVDDSVTYFRQYDPEAVGAERRRHNEKIENYYRGILKNSDLLARHKEPATVD